jgi:serine phosphatase RsbU (regulator of sigma subunit)
MHNDDPDVQLMRQRGTALLVDRDPASRDALRAQLEREGFVVVTAARGLEALAKYEQHQPDIVLLDAMLPDLYGYDVARALKKMAGDRFVPMIFLSALDEEHAIGESVEAGGDEFLTKPCNYAVLSSKIIAVERMRDLYEKVRVQHKELNRLHARTQYEQDIAQRILTKAVMASNVCEPPVQCMLRAASTFNGDVLISALTPSGGLSLLLGDFTGHGLAAAIGALPVSEIFRAMTKTGFGLQEVLAEINRKLHRMLPTGMFLAAAAVRIEPDLRAAVVWNSGLPDVILRGQDGVRRRIPSLHPPLGALAEFLPGCTTALIDLVPGDAFVLCSDGVTEANNATGEMFGEARFDRVIAINKPADIFDAICTELCLFIGDAPQVDDVSIAVVPCIPALFPQPLAATGSTHGICCPSGSDWAWSLALHGANLSRIDPVPIVINQLAAFGVSQMHRDKLFIIITAIYSNALEHGVLRLRAANKSTAEGYVAYHSQRQHALAALRDGHIRIDIIYRCNGANGALQLRIEDSGNGFDHESLAVEKLGGGEVCKGLSIVRSLCESMVHNDRGSAIQLEYLFH